MESPSCTHLLSQRTLASDRPLPRGHFSTLINHRGGPREEEGRSLWLTIKKVRHPASGPAPRAMKLGLTLALLSLLAGEKPSPMPSNPMLPYAVSSASALPT